jgi:hypothetical protein
LDSNKNIRDKRTVSFISKRRIIYWIFLYEKTASHCRVKDPHHFKSFPYPDPHIHLTADPDLAFHFDAYLHPDPAPHQGDANLQPLVTGQQTLQGSI